MRPLTQCCKVIPSRPARLVSFRARSARSSTSAGVSSERKTETTIETVAVLFDEHALRIRSATEMASCSSRTVSTVANSSPPSRPLPVGPR